MRVALKTRPYLKRKLQPMPKAVIASPNIITQAAQHRPSAPSQRVHKACGNGPKFRNGFRQAPNILTFNAKPSPVDRLAKVRLRAAQEGRPLRIALLNTSHGDINSPEQLYPYVESAVKGNRALPIFNFLRPALAKVGWLFIKNSLKEQYNSFNWKTNYKEKSESQAEALTKALEKKGTKVKTFIGFNFTEPKIPEAMAQIRAYNPDLVIVLNQGAQYSKATTGSSFEEVREDMLKFSSSANAPAPLIVGIEEFSSSPKFRTLLASSIKDDVVKAFKDTPFSEVLVLLASHGLPDLLVAKGDPALKQMARATEEIKKQLPQELKILSGYLNDDFVPGASWSKPAVADLLPKIKAAVAAGRKNILLDGRLSFTVHHRATLYDLNVELRKLIERECPEANISFAGSFDDDPRFARVQADIITDYMKRQPNDLAIIYP